MKPILLILTIAASMASAQMRPGKFSGDDHIRNAPKQKSRISQPKNLVQGTYSQSIDHFGNLSGQTFSQRYWVDSQYAKAGASAPVIFHICGEMNVDDAYFLNDYAIQWAQQLGAHLVYLEHRYYGQSQPFSDLSTDHIQYLSLENVIEDFANFETWLKTQNAWTGPWISVGGSYSGTLSAIYRLKHPELVVGALASSAPMISGKDQLDDGSDEDTGVLSNTSASPDASDRQWFYQACVSVGFWNADGDSIDSTIMDPSSSFCQGVFGNIQYVDNNAFNQKYSTPFMNAGSGAPSNVLFTYGSNDVWTNIGFTQQSNQNPGISILTINGAGHHFDLNAPDSSDSSDVLAARATFAKLAQQWISASQMR